MLQQRHARARGGGTSSPQESRYGAGSSEPSSLPTHSSMDDLAIKKGPAERLHSRACAAAKRHAVRGKQRREVQVSIVPVTAPTRAAAS